jgi:hypothetical protein
MINLFKRGIETLRQPDRNPRCYELTDEERLSKSREWQVTAVQNIQMATLKDNFYALRNKDHIR